jgi:hypothetical protein
MTDLQKVLDYLTHQWLPPEIQEAYQRLARGTAPLPDRCVECGDGKDNAAFPTCEKKACIAAHRRRLRTRHTAELRR